MTALNDNMLARRRMAAEPEERAIGPRMPVQGIVVVLSALASAIVSFVVLMGLTPIAPDARVTITAMSVNGIFIAWLLYLIGKEIWRIVVARRRGKAASRLHVRIVALFSLVAAIPALAVAVVASVTLDIGLDRWFEIRTKAIVNSSLQVAESYLNENAVNLRDTTVNLAFVLDSQRSLYSLDRTGFNALLTQQAIGRGLLGAWIVRPEGTPVFKADVKTDRPLPAPPRDALTAAEGGGPVIIPPGVTNLVGSVIRLREIPQALLYTVRAVDPEVIEAMRLMEENTTDYQGMEQNRTNIQIAFALLYLGLTLVVLLSAIWTGIAVANRLVRPIRQLIGAAESVSEGNLEASVPIRKSDGDVAYLGETFNTMLRQLKTQRNEILDAKDQIDERRRFSEAVLAGVTAAVIGVDSEGRITIVNRSGEHVLGATQENALGRELAEMLPEVGEVYDAARQSGRTGFRRQVNFRTANGGERTLNVQVTMEEAESAEHSYVITIDDISDLVEAQRSMAWADVARRIAHEIKNPLTPIQLSAERIRRRYGKVITEDREVFEQCTDTIIRQVGDIGRMVDEFSSFARMPKPKMEVRDLRDTLREATFLIEVSREDIRFEREFEDAPLICRFDERLMGQAIGNVIKNASEAIEAVRLTGVAHTGHIVVRAYHDGADTIRIDVIDNGKGLPAENRHRLLEPYMTTREKGTGLGLAIVKKIVEEHGGELQLHDAPPDFHDGRGAMIRIVLPAAEADAHAGENERS